LDRTATKQAYFLPCNHPVPLPIRTHVETHAALNGSHEIWYWIVIWKFAKPLQFLFRLDNFSDDFTWWTVDFCTYRHLHPYIVLAWFLHGSSCFPCTLVAELHFNYVARAWMRETIQSATCPFGTWNAIQRPSGGAKHEDMERYQRVQNWKEETSCLRVPGVHTNSTCTFPNEMLQETVVPAAEFDWINSGLVNPLDCK
jgi:hypothetical protein